MAIFPGKMIPKDEDHSESSQRKPDKCIDEDKLEDESKEKADPNIFDKPCKSKSNFNKEFESIRKLTETGTSELREQLRESIGKIEICNSFLVLLGCWAVSYCFTACSREAELD